MPQQQRLLLLLAVCTPRLSTSNTSFIVLLGRFDQCSWLPLPYFLIAVHPLLRPCYARCCLILFTLSCDWEKQADEGGAGKGVVGTENISGSRCHGCCSLWMCAMARSQQKLLSCLLHAPQLAGRLRSTRTRATPFCRKGESAAQKASQLTTAPWGSFTLTRPHPVRQLGTKLSLPEATLCSPLVHSSKMAKSNCNGQHGIMHRSQES